MSYEKIARVATALSNQTLQNKITWKQTEDATTFVVSFPQYSVFISKEEFEDSYGREQAAHVLRITNENGEIVEEVTSYDLQSHLSDSWGTLKEMYETARRQAMGVEKALDSILEIIDPDIPF